MIGRAGAGLLDTDSPLESLKTIQEEEANVIKEIDIAEAGSKFLDSKHGEVNG